jgi:hypothetical protein
MIQVLEASSMKDWLGSFLPLNSITGFFLKEWPSPFLHPLFALTHHDQISNAMKLSFCVIIVLVTAK